MKTKLQGILGIFLVIAAFGMLAACGGGDGGGATGGSGGATTEAGRFIDGPTVGLGYESGAHSGVTAADGSFTYQSGKSVRFFVGNVNLGEAPARHVMMPLHLVPGSNAATPQVVNIARFLLSIGTLNGDNSITIPQVITDAAARKVEPVNVTTLTEAELDALVKSLKGDAATLVDASTAISHLSASILNEYQGTYRGRFHGVVGDPDRTWMLEIKLDGTVVGYGSNKMRIDGVRQKETITGTISNGTDFAGAAYGGCRLDGKLDVTTGILSGTWWYPSDPGINGTFSGKER